MDLDRTLTTTLQLIAEGVIEFAGFDLAAVSLVADGVLHTAAVEGDPEAAAQLVDLRAPIELVELELQQADAWGNLRFLPAERAAGHLDGHDWTPDLDRTERDDAWDARDLLCGLLHDDAGQLRGLLSVDLPTNGRRPSEAQLTTLQMYVRLAERALVTALERGDLAVRIERERVLTDYRRSVIDVLTHELRGTAGAITNTVELVREQSDLDPTTVSALAVIDGGSDRIRAVVDDMSAIAELGRADTPVRTEVTDLGAITREAVALHGAGARLRGISLDLQVAGDTSVVGDPKDLDRMVANLLSNAIKYSDRGGQVHARVRSEAAASEGTGAVVLTVTDTGLGIEPSEQDQVFDEFFRSSAEAVRRRAGAGLGLAIVDRIVALHGGTVHLDSAVGRGSTFTVVLPRAESSRAAG